MKQEKHQADALLVAPCRNSLQDERESLLLKAIDLHYLGSSWLMFSTVLDCHLGTSRLDSAKRRKLIRLRFDSFVLFDIHLDQVSTVLADLHAVEDPKSYGKGDEFWDGEPTSC